MLVPFPQGNIAWRQRQEKLGLWRKINLGLSPGTFKISTAASQGDCFGGDNTYLVVYF